MISLLCPTRGRPASLRRMVESARATATGPIEIICRIDNDDSFARAAADALGLPVVVGPRKNLSALWDDCLPLARGEIVGMLNDDVIFRSESWDKLIEKTFSDCPDKIVMVHADDLSGNGERFGPHLFVHRRWVDTLGYFSPPHFPGDYADTWINDIANILGRRVYLPHVEIEHMHPMWHKGEIDATYRERMDRQSAAKSSSLYARLSGERIRDAARLEKLMDHNWTCKPAASQPKRSRSMRIEWTSEGKRLSTIKGTGMIITH